MKSTCTSRGTLVSNVVSNSTMATMCVAIYKHLRVMIGIPVTGVEGNRLEGHLETRTY